MLLKKKKEAGSIIENMFVALLGIVMTTAFLVIVFGAFASISDKWHMNQVARVYKNSKELQYLCSLQRNQIDYSQAKYRNYIYVNCWIWEPGSIITITQNGKELKVEKVTDSDPLAAKVVFAKPTIFKTKKESAKTNRLALSANMFRAKATDIKSPVVITVTTPTGGTYTQTLARPATFPVE